MALCIAILEDDPQRIAEMRRCLGEQLPNLESVFFDNAPSMMRWLDANLPDVLLISLDHDLPLRDVDGQSVDSGTGRQVADYLASLPPTCPVIVHSSNQNFAPGMVAVLQPAWLVAQVYPYDDCQWISKGWIEQVLRLVRAASPEL